MEHKFYSHCNLLVVSEDAGERLFKIERRKNKRKPVPVDFINGVQKFIKVYCEYNLIVTPTVLFTLNGEIVSEGYFACAETMVCQGVLLLVLRNSPGGSADKALLWDGVRVIWQQTASAFVYTDKYIAVFQKEHWQVYDFKGLPIKMERKLSYAIQIKGDLLISDAVGCHDVYSLKTGELIMGNQMLVRASEYRDFAIGVNLQNTATLWYAGKFMTFDNVAFVDIIDEIELFYIKYKNFTYYSVFGYAGSMFELSRDLEFTAVDFISYDKDKKQLAIVCEDNIAFYKVTRVNDVVTFQSPC